MVKIKKEYIELRKSGKFYSSFGDDATILHYLLSYKLKSDNNGVGFPESAYNKVINCLEEEKISYKVYEKGELTEQNNFKKLNSYKSILKKGIYEISIEQRIEQIKISLNEMSKKELNRVLEIIENAISE